MTVPSQVQKVSYWMSFTRQEYTDALQRCCIEMGLDPDGTNEEMQARIAARWAELYDAIGRACDAAFPTTPDQLPGHPLVTPQVPHDQ